MFESDGRPVGDVNITTVQCNNSVCPVYVPAPGFALVFLSSSALSESNSGTTQTFPTTFLTKTANTATIPASVLATSNGQKGLAEALLGSTSAGSNKNAAMVGARIGVGLVTATLVGVGLLVSKLR